MTHHRRPGTVESVLYHQICKRPPLRLEEFTGVTVDLFFKNSNPTTTHNLCAVHIPNLDAALVAEGREPAFIPLLQKLYERALEDHGVSVSARKGGDPMDEMLSLIKSAGDLADHVRFAVCPKGEGGHNVTSRERDCVVSAIEEIRVKLDALERTVDGASDNVQPIHSKEAS